MASAIAGQYSKRNEALHLTVHKGFVRLTNGKGQTKKEESSITFRSALRLGQ